jgi:RNA polymerase subunit RPABC4/transcription elongation factor Spt4
MKRNIFKIAFITIISIITLGMIGMMTLAFMRVVPHDVPPLNPRMFVVMPIVLIVGLSLISLIGVLIFKDAKKAGLNPWMWLCIVFFMPNGIGFIIYLVYRLTRKKELTCEKCGYLVKSDYVVCPNCGDNLKATCPHCDQPIETDWNVCPHCKGEL